MLLLVAEHDGLRQSCIAARFPFVIGRASGAHFRLDAPGVWDAHASIETTGPAFAIKPCGDALLLINGERSAGGVLRPGDRISAGAANILVSLSPAEQHRLGRIEGLNWFLVAAVFAFELLILLALL